jgi:hypothetical protein
MAVSDLALAKAIKVLKSDANPAKRSEVRQKISQAKKDWWANQENRKRVSRKLEEAKSRMFTKEELEELYLNQKKSMAKIAREKRCSIGGVQYLLEKYEIPRRSSGEGVLIALTNPERKLKISKAQKKAWNNLDYRKKMSMTISKAKRGEKSHFWKGGKTKITMLLRESAKYNLWRQSVYIRDNFTCQKCGEKGGNLVAHHKKPFSKLLDEVKKNLPLFDLYEGALIYSPLWDVDNGITLCLKCHKKIHKIGGKKQW